MDNKSYASALLSINQVRKIIPDCKPLTNYIVSYGIACTRKNPNTDNYEVLMIKKRVTYNFIEFVRGRYDPSHYSELIFMISGMTILEKTLIRTKCFHTLWMYCWGREAIKNSDKNMYSKSMKKFDQLCIYTDKKGCSILDILNKSNNSELLWEIPKGRIGKNESPIDSAIREFEEETGLSKSAYELLFNEGTVEYTFSDNGIRYKYIYYLAKLNQGYHPRFDFNNEHMLIEVSGIKFMPANAVYEFNNNRLYKTVQTIIKKSKKYYK